MKKFSMNSNSKSAGVTEIVYKPNNVIKFFVNFVQILFKSLSSFKNIIVDCLLKA